MIGCREWDYVIVVALWLPASSRPKQERLSLIPIPPSHPLVQRKILTSMPATKDNLQQWETTCY